jgi:hypothetical protein
MRRPWLRRSATPTCGLLMTLCTSGRLRLHVDAHTYIHESGHLMGLPDYYCYDTASNPTTGKRSHPSPLGGVAMMDENVSDHDIATKFALGWLHPYVVNGACDLTLRPSQTSGDCLLFPAKGSTWNGSAFTEYLLLELYTPTGLNELDATTAYSYHPQGYTLPGVRLLHVDARIVDWSSGAYEEDPQGSFISGHFYGVGANNTPSRRHGEASTGNYDAMVNCHLKCNTWPMLQRSSHWAFSNLCIS